MNTNDVAIKRTREVRHQISERFNHDPQKVLDYYMELQKKFTKRLVKSKPVESVTISKSSD